VDGCRSEGDIGIDDAPWVRERCPGDGGEHVDFFRKAALFIGFLDEPHLVHGLVERVPAGRRPPVGVVDGLGAVDGGADGDVIVDEEIKLLPVHEQQVGDDAHVQVALPVLVHLPCLLYHSPDHFPVEEAFPSLELDGGIPACAREDEIHDFFRGLEGHHVLPHGDARMAISAPVVAHVGGVDHVQRRRLEKALVEVGVDACGGVDVLAVDDDAGVAELRVEPHRGVDVFRAQQPELVLGEECPAAEIARDENPVLRDGLSCIRENACLFQELVGGCGWHGGWDDDESGEETEVSLWGSQLYACLVFRLLLLGNDRKQCPLQHQANDFLVPVELVEIVGDGQHLLKELIGEFLQILRLILWNDFEDNLFVPVPVKDEVEAVEEDVGSGIDALERIDLWIDADAQLPVFDFKTRPHGNTG